MRTQDFISSLRQAPAKRLVFSNSDGATIHGGYHLTELKAASFDRLLQIILAAWRTQLGCALYNVTC